MRIQTRQDHDARQLDLFSRQAASSPRGRKPLLPANDNRRPSLSLPIPRPLTRVEVERAAELDRMLALRSALRRAMEKTRK